MSLNEAIKDGKEIVIFDDGLQDRSISYDIKLVCFNSFKWIGNGINSRCYDDKGNCIIQCSKKYFRPLEVDSLLGNASKAKKELKWKPKFKINDLVKEMVSYENLNQTKDD